MWKARGGGGTMGWVRPEAVEHGGDVCLLSFFGMPQKKGSLLVMMIMIIIVNNKT